MILRAFAIFDLKGACYANPFFLPKEAMAIRGFTDAVNDPKSFLYEHPEDYVLHDLGTFDTELGILESGIGSKPIVNASSVKRSVMVAPHLMGAAKVIAERGNVVEVAS